jgi:hypothetical protein
MKSNSAAKFQNYYQLMFNDTPLNPTNGLADPLGTANGSMHACDLLASGASPVNASNSGSANPAYFADADGGAGVQLSTGAGDTAQHMAIFQIDTGVTDPVTTLPALRVSTWLDASLAAPLGAPGAVQYYDLSAAEQAGSITGVRMQGSNQGSTTNNRWFFLDEVKFGTTAADVGANVPEPACVSLVGLGALGLLRRRSRS